MQRSTGEAFVHLEGRGLGTGRTKRLKRSLLEGASGAALARMASAALALGVALPSVAEAQTTVNPVQATTYNISPSSNPITFGAATNLTGGAYGANTTQWNITNQGSIQGSFGPGAQLAGVFLNGSGTSGPAGGSVTNQTSGSIAGVKYGVKVAGATGSVTNAGAITGTAFVPGAGVGVLLAAGGSVSNQAGGSIYGTTIGVKVAGAAGSVTNAGTITGMGIAPGTGVGVLLAAGGSVTNQAGGGIFGHYAGVQLATGGSVTNQGAGGGAPAGKISGNYYGVFVTGGSGTVTNAGAISATSSGINSYGVLFTAGGTVTNQTGGSISGAGYGVKITNAAGSVTNAATITGTNGDGVLLDTGGTVANSVGGAISGGSHGVAVYGGSGSVTNAGTITGTNSHGVYFNAGGTVTNNTGGVISGRYGVYIWGGSGTVTNAGQITGSNGDGVKLAAGGSVTNQAGGSITGTTYGITIKGASGTVTNTGTITGTSWDGVYLRAGGTVANNANGVISGGRNGVDVGGASGTVTNAGQITGSGGYGVVLGAGGSVTNQASGSITGSAYGVGVFNQSGTVTNAGTITGQSSAGVYLDAGGSVTNQAGGSISGSGGVAIAAGGSVNNQTGGSISGSNYGVVFFGGPGTVTNAGTITGTGFFGVGLASGGTVTNQTGGSIYGGDVGVLIDGGSATVTNAGAITGKALSGVFLTSGGTVTNQTGGSISGAKYGVLIPGGAASVTNAGVITGANASVLFAGSGANVLTLQTGSVLNGEAIGSTAAGATNALVLQGRGEADNVFLNFQTLSVQATGTWTLGGTNSIGSTAVASGTLLVNGALTSTTATVNGGTLEVGDQAHASAKLTSAVTVNAGGVLGGHGTIVGDVTNNGGTVSPGGTIGVLTINGNYAQSAGGVLSIEVSPAPKSSQLQVNGTATLSGSLQLAADPGIYRKGVTFDVLNATTISGGFSTATASNGMSIAAEVQGQEVLAVVTSGVATLAPGATANQQATANAFANVPVGTSDFDPVANAILGMSGAQQNGAFDRLGGEVYADLLVAGRDSARAFLGGLSDQMSADASNRAGAGKTAVWGRAFGSFGSIYGEDGAHGYSNDAGGVFFGVERHLAGDTVLGASASYGRTDISLRGLAQSGELDTGAVALFGEHRAGMVFVDGALSYSYDHGQGHRTIALPGILARRASSGFSGDVLGGLVEAGLRFERMGFTWEPSLGVLYSQVNQDGFTESGAGGADLAVAAKSLNAAESLAGVRFSRILHANGGTWKFDGRLAWTHERGALTPTIDERFAAAPGTNFTLAGARLNPDSGVFGAGLTYDRSANLSFYARYQGVVGQHETQNAVTLGARFVW